MSLEWREQLSVGNDMIDFDHKRLIDIINQVERCFATQNLTELYAGLYSLSQYSQMHFAREEKIAQAAGYSGVAHLNEAHQSLVKQLEQLTRDIEAMGQEWSPVEIGSFTKFLRSWLIGHVIKEDLLMKDTLKKFPSSLGPG
jgi:hemerythrin